MTATRVYRTASVLLFLCAAGQTYGLRVFWHIAGRMPPVLFPQGDSGFSYAHVVLGYEAFVSLCILFAAYLAWHLGTLARTLPQAIGLMGWIFFGYSIVGFCISWIALSGFVRLLTAAIAICIGWATGLATRNHRIQQGQGTRALV